MTRDMIIEKFRENYMDVARRRADAAIELATAEVDVTYMDAVQSGDDKGVVRVAMRKAAAMIDYEAVKSEVDAVVGHLRAEMLRVRGSAG